ncbi:MAG: hypothetical protein ACREQ5_09310 [Candidatus Dormibacteria bacterium]
MENQFKVGDKVHLGLAVKGGGGFKGHIEQIHHGKGHVHVRSIYPTPRLGGGYHFNLYKGPISHLTMMHPATLENLKQNVDGQHLNIGGGNMPEEIQVTETTGTKIHHKQETYKANQAHEHEFITSLRAKFGEPKNTRVETEVAKNGTPQVSHIYLIKGKHKVHVGSWNHKAASGTYKMYEDTQIVDKLSKEDTITETLPADATSSDYVNDFVHSKNKMFKGESKAQRIRRALGAYYSQHKGKK